MYFYKPQRRIGTHSPRCGTLPRPLRGTSPVSAKRPFAIDCCCVNRPKVDVFDCRGGAMVKLGIISVAWQVRALTG